MVPIPGASAVLAALTASGLPSDAFLFAGFLPVKDGQRQTRLAALDGRAGDADLLRIAAPAGRYAWSPWPRCFGDRPAAIGRELTKTFEEMRTGTLAALAGALRRAPTPKGEIVICVGPPEERTDAPEDIDRLLMSLAAEMPASKAAAEAARMTGQPKQALYRRLLELKDG